MLVIRRRIDKWGVAEVDVRKLGTDSIQISLPGQQDPEQAKELIGTTAQLEFRMVDEKNPYFSQLVAKHPPPADSGIRLVQPNGYDQLEGKDREALLAYARTGRPAGPRGPARVRERPGPRRALCDSYLTYLVDKAVPLTGESLATRRRQPQPDQQRLRGEPLLRHAGRRRVREAHRGQRRPLHGHRPRRERQLRARASTSASPTAGPASPWDTRCGKTDEQMLPGGPEPRPGAPGRRAARPGHAWPRSVRSARASGTS